MFKQTQQIDKAFRQLQVFTICVVVASTAVSLYTVRTCLQTVRAGQSRIYVLANAEVLAATASDRKDNLEVEARAHVIKFHEYFFNLDPDDKVIQSNLSKAMYLADVSAKREYDRLNEQRYFQTVVSGNVSQRITLDSVLINTSRDPYYFRCYATLAITRPTVIMTRGMITQGYLRTVSRSDNNPHGFLIEKWEILENNLHTRMENR